MQGDFFFISFCNSKTMSTVLSFTKFKIDFTTILQIVMICNHVVHISYWFSS